MVNQREYHTGTWEYINVASDYLIPFQWTGGSDSYGKHTITSIDTDGAGTDITAKFYGAELMTSWSLTGTGTWNTTAPQFTCTSTVAADIITSNSFTLTSGHVLKFYINLANFSNKEDWNLYIKKGAATVYTKTGFDTWTTLWGDGYIYFISAATGSDYTVVIECDESSRTVTTTTATGNQSLVVRSGLYYWYPGSQLTSGSFSNIFRLKIEHYYGVSSAYTYYSDWIDPCGFTGKAKIKVSSSYDYGGIKYAAGYVQYMYKAATIRRDPKAEITITGDSLNGERQNEKITAAVRYTMRMKCTESEFEALVHAMAGTIEITDGAGKVYDAQNVELGDPTMYRTNGIVELTFIDGNNINVWSRNNSAL